MKNICDWKNCSEIANYKAPIEKDNSKKFRLLCLEHIKEFNKNWNYFSGMNNDQIYEFIKSDNWLDAPRKIRNLRNPKQVKLKAKQMCKLIPEGQILYVKSKCGQRRKGWKIIIDNDKPFCTKKKIYFKENI